MKQILFATVFTSIAALSTVAVAQEQSGSDIQIQGDTTIKAKVETVTTTAAGSDNIAETNIGTIGGDSVQIQGDTKIDVEAGTVTTSAAGSGNCAKTNIGSIGAKAC